MAKSKSKKRREHLIRNGKMLAQENLSKVDFSIHERKTPTLTERVRRRERKHVRRFSEYDLAN